MALRLMLWAFALLFIATIWNVITAYNGMAGMNVHGKFQQIGLLEGGIANAEFPLPPKKPLMLQELAANN